MSTSLDRRHVLFGGAAIGAGAFLTGCTNSSDNDKSAPQVKAGASSSGATAGKAVTIGFSAPAADHGWTAAITINAKAQAQQYSDVTLKATEGTNDVAAQIQQVQSLIDAKVDALVILPFDGKALTEIAKKAMASGIPVINLDRIFASGLAYRTWIGGDNYGMGVNAGTFIARRMKAAGKTDPVIVEVAGIDNLELTQQRSKGFKDALAANGLRLAARQAADFTAATGQRVTAQLLQATPKIDAMWNHDDDQGIGVLAAIKQAQRDKEFVVVGGAGSRKAMESIKADDSPVKATVLYSPSMASSSITVARLIAQGHGMADLVEHEVPASVTTFSAVVTKENVDQYMAVGFS
ncbi:MULTISPECIES: substrate-binding domain-containing protein [unclassified Streptomyces]|uniref:substrate-binding domain-containing protein n=1 Tax=unclassified Streptomyces TaxID=2593676 RepID=UPI0020334C25|nr:MULTISPECIES: substrate-binding domain-containing protein [unclassified Streptomyces]MCM2423464.1 substrate-binding domain-containing protein [Streptomyces sp. RKAG293]MCM2430868.1 substrate-binding domain-containing protein [Streptomyces sp. RKAG337]